MIVSKIYNRTRAVAYASRWAFDRNPLYFDYTGMGGNCTNFVSQCLYAGGCVMNYTPVFGWYYLNAMTRTASWTGVEFLYNFLIGNDGSGPVAREVGEGELESGDVIQLGRNGEGYYHTLLVTGSDENTYLVSSQSDDAFDRPLSTYRYDYARYLHITKVNIFVEGFTDCYLDLLSGTRITLNDSVSTLPPNIPTPPPEQPEQPQTQPPESPPETQPQLPPEATPQTPSAAPRIAEEMPEGEEQIEEKAQESKEE